MVVGGYRSPFVYRPPYVSPVWVLTGVAVGVAVGSSRRKAPCPWYMAPQKSFKSGGKAVPLETWPMIVFDLARCGFCSRLDKPNGVSQHRHEVPGDSVNVRFDAWEAPIDGPIDEWPASVPTSHASVAIALVTYCPPPLILYRATATPPSSYTVTLRHCPFDSPTPMPHTPHGNPTGTATLSSSA
jgi:hypothetical protein